MMRVAAGESAKLPYRILRQIVAAQLGQLPAAVDAMPFDDFSDAVATTSLTRIVSIGGKRE